MGPFKIGKEKNSFENVNSEITGTIKKSLPKSIFFKVVPIILIILIIIAGTSWLTKLFGENNASQVAMDEVFSKQISIAKNANGDYYFKIKKTIVDEVIAELNKAYEEGNYEIDLSITFNDEDAKASNSVDDEKPGNLNDGETEITINTLEDWFNTDNKEDVEAYLVKMIRAECESMNPRLSSYKGEAGTEDSQGNRKDKDGDYVAQGIIQLKRTKLNYGGGVNVDTTSKNGKATRLSPRVEPNSNMEYFAVVPTEMKDNLPLVVYLPGDGGWNYMNDYSFIKYIENGQAYKSEECIFLVPNYVQGQENNTMTLIESIAQQYNVDPGRIVLTGGSRGAMGAQKIVNNNPDYFAALVLLSGFKVDVDPKNFTTTPVIAYSGNVGEDELASATYMQRFVDSVNKAGGNATFTSLDGCDHSSLQNGAYNILGTDGIWKDIIYPANRENPTELRPEVDLDKDSDGLYSITVGATIDLKYKPLEEFVASPSLDYFTYSQESGVIYYATFDQEISTLNGEVTSSNYSLDTNNQLSLKALTNLCTMPYNFLFSLLQTTENAEYVMAVADLLIDQSEVVVMIQDQLSITAIKNVSHKVERTQTQDITIGAGATVQGFGEINSTYNFPASEDDKEVKVDTTISNTTIAYIKTAKTWCLDYEEEATLNVSRSSKTNKSKYSDSDFAGLKYTITWTNENALANGFKGLTKEALDAILSQGVTLTLKEKGLSDSYVLSETIINTTVGFWNISTKTERTINYERFLGLWKNDRGVYYKGALYKEDGLIVPYKISLEEENKEKAYPAIMVTTSQNGEDIDTLIELLSRHNDTQLHEQLMMYYWNIYSKRDVYNINIKETLSLFNDEMFKKLLDALTEGNTKYEKLYFALIGAGYSENSAIGAIAAISVYDAQDLGNTSQDKLKMSEEDYAAKVDNGSYKDFINDGVAFGVGRWTTPERKKGLLEYAKSKGVSVGDEDTQIEFLLSEVDIARSGDAANYTKYQLKRYGDDWANADTPESAALYFYSDFFQNVEGAILETLNDNILLGGSATNIASLLREQANRGGSSYAGRRRGLEHADGYEGGGYYFPYYLQDEFSGRYGAPGRSIASSGCGPTSIAMALSGLLGKQITPNDVVNGLKSYFNSWHDYYQEGAGSKMNICDDGFLESFDGITAIKDPTNNGYSRGDVRREVTNNGASAIIWTPGHIVTMIPPTAEQKTQGYQFQIVDPFWPDRNAAYKSLGDFASALRSLGYEGTDHQLFRFWGLIWNEEDKANGGPSGERQGEGQGGSIIPDIMEGAYDVAGTIQGIYQSAPHANTNSIVVDPDDRQSGGGTTR